MNLSEINTVSELLQQNQQAPEGLTVEAAMEYVEGMSITDHQKLAVALLEQIGDWHHHVAAHVVKDPELTDIGLNWQADAGKYDVVIGILNSIEVVDIDKEEEEEGEAS